jgi:hypothetical protein
MEEYKQGEMWHSAQRAEISEEICMFQPGHCHDIPGQHQGISYYANKQKKAFYTSSQCKKHNFNPFHYPLLLDKYKYTWKFAVSDINTL